MGTLLQDRIEKWCNVFANQIAQAKVLDIGCVGQVYRTLLESRQFQYVG